MIIVHAYKRLSDSARTFVAFLVLMSTTVIAVLISGIVSGDSPVTFAISAMFPAILVGMVVTAIRRA